MALAAELRIDASQLSQILNGEAQCSPALAAKIELVTRGQINRMDVLYPRESRNPFIACHF